MDDEPRTGGRNAGAFLGPDVLIVAPMRTLSDEIPGEPTELEAERRPPRDPSPKDGRRGLWDRILRTLRRDR